MTTDRDALRNAILAHPDEDTPRLIFADLLDEEGEHAWAARIRDAIETHRRESRDDWAALLTPYLNDWWHDFEHPKPVPPAEWWSLIPDAARNVGAMALGLESRGFVGGLSCWLDEFLLYAVEWFRKWPIQHVVLFDKRPLVAGPRERCAWLSDVVPENELASASVLPREWIRDMARWGVGLSEPDSTARWFGTVEAACAAVSEHCVALGRQAALSGDPP
jgi:uncharacterized protein (TIGR02996 family)